MSEIPYSQATGIELSLSWRPDSYGHYPEGALSAHPNLYVIRAKHENAENTWVPGKLQVNPDSGRPCAYISYEGYAIAVEHYEVLVCSGMADFGCGYSWVPVEDDKLPPRALVAGADKKGLLFVARGTSAALQGEICVGKYSPGRKAALVPSGGKEHKLEKFDVLAFK